MRNRLLLAFLLGCLPMLAKAQTDTLIHSSQQLGEVVVTGTGTAHYLKDAPVQTEVITRSMLRNYSGRSISDILTALSPGFDISPQKILEFCIFQIINRIRMNKG